MIGGALLLGGGFVLGLGGTLIGMLGAFSSVAESATPPSPAQLTAGVSLALITTAIGVAISVIGLCLVIGGLVAWLLERR
jgi:biopolymer transport protein ExbB/TolQ